MSLEFNKKIIVCIAVLMMLLNVIAIAEAASPSMPVQSQGIFSGKTTAQIENIISKMSEMPMIYFAKQNGITQIKGKKISDIIKGNVKPRSPKTQADSPMGTDPNFWENEPSISISPTNKNLVVGTSHKYDINFNVQCVTYRSTNGGATWSSPKNLPLVPGTVCSDPVVRWSPDGSKVYASYLSYDSTNSYALVSRSTDGGITWSSPVKAITAAPGDFIDKEWLDVHTFWNNANTSNKVYLSATTFHSDGSMDISFTKSTFGGAAFGAVQTLATATGSPVVIQGSRPIGGKSNSGTSGDVLVCWYNSGTDGWLNGGFDERCKASTNYGLSFGPEVIAVRAKNYELPYYLYGPANPSVITYHRWWGGMFPSIAIGPDGTAYMTFAADPINFNDGFGTAGDIFFARSPRPFTTWSYPRAPITDDSYGAKGYPSITAKQTTLGTVLSISFEDHRNSPYSTPADEDCGYGPGIGNAFNCYYDIYNAQTSPGGADFLTNPNKRLTDISSLSNLGYPFIGDYIDSSTSKDPSDLTFIVDWTDRTTENSVFSSDTDVWSDRPSIKIN